MAIAEQIKADLHGAMRAGEKEKVGALRLVLSELQKAAKEGADDELAVLRRERKRRLEAAKAFRDGGRDDLADGEEAEGELIGALPARRALRGGAARIVAAGRAARAAPRPQGHGRGDEAGDGRRRRPRRRQARIRARAGVAQRMRTQVELSNDVAAELAGSQDVGPARARGAPSTARSSCAGTCSPSTARSSETHAGQRVVRELSELIYRGHQIGPGTIAAVTGALDAHESPARVLEDVVWQHRGLRVAPKTVNQKRYVDSRAREHGHVRRRPGRDRQDVPRRRDGRRRPQPPRGQPHHPHPPAVEAGERLGFLPGDLMAKVDPYLRPLFDALHDMLDPEKVSQHIERGVIEIAPLAFMRGRTLNDSFVILDEAQNTTPEQMKMFLTRLGFGSRMVVTGMSRRSTCRASSAPG